MANTHSHTHSVPRDTHGGWSFEQGLDAILTYVGVDQPLLNNWAVNIGRTEWEVGGECNGKHTHTHTQFPS